MKLLRFILVLFTIVLLAGCARFRADDSASNYKQFAKIVPPVKNPPGIVVKKGRNYYPIPRISYSPVRAKVSILPPGSKIAQYAAQDKRKKFRF